MSGDLTDIAVEDIQFIVVPPMNDPVAVAENPLTHLQLGLAGGGRIGCLLDDPVEIGGTQAAAVIGERIWISPPSRNTWESIADTGGPPHRRRQSRNGGLTRDAPWQESP